jgi:Carboxypeptidase regulatory-like domain
MTKAPLLVVLALWCVPAGAGQVPPPRDESRPTVGTASISGVVVTDETPPQPVRRAVVTLTGADLRPSRGAITDDEGRFTIGGLPSGRFVLTAMRPSFVTSTYGAKRPGRPGTPVLLTAGQTQNVVVRIWRGAVIAGVLRDDMGEPVDGVPVTVVRLRGSAGSSLTLSNNGGQTNDRGEYRIFGLEPGTYIVSARPLSAGSTSPMIAMATAEVDAALEALRQLKPAGGVTANRQPDPTTASRPFDLAPIYYPGTPSRTDASPITLVAGQEATGMDFALQRVVTWVVEGQLTRPDGQRGTGAEVQLTPAGSSDFVTEQESILNATVDPDGTFRFRQVTPGNYTLFARAPAQPPAASPRTAGLVTPGPQGPQLWATTPLSVGSDISGIALTLRPAFTLSGRVRFDSGTLKPPENLTQLRVMLFPPEIQNVRSGVPIRSIAFVPPGTVRADGTFELTNVVPGRYVLAITGVPLDGTGWWARSAILGGRDLLDGPIDISSDTNLAGVEVTFTDRRSELSGTLQTSTGDAASDVFVIAFAADRGFWGPNARRVQAVRPGVDGKYVIRDLPPGDYLLAAVTDVDQDEWQDPAFLERLQPGSIKVAIAEGEKKTLDLRIGG